MSNMLDIPKLIHGVLALVQPDFTLSAEAVILIHKLLLPIYQHIQNGVPANMPQVACQVIPGELFKHAMSEYRKSNTPTFLTPELTPDRIIEYLASEIVELSGMATLGVYRKSHQPTTIALFDVYVAIMGDDELYPMFRQYIPIFPYIREDIKEVIITPTRSYTGDVLKLLEKKTEQLKVFFPSEDNFEEGMENIIRCLIRVYHQTHPTQLLTYTDAIAKKAGRIRDPSFRGLESFVYEIMLTIYAYSKALQPTGLLSFNTLLQASLVNPYLQGLVDMPNTFLQCLRQVEFDKVEPC